MATLVNNNPKSNFDGSSTKKVTTYFVTNKEKIKQRKPLKYSYLVQKRIFTWAIRCTKKQIAVFPHSVPSHKQPLNSHPGNQSMAVASVLPQQALVHAITI